MVRGFSLSPRFRAGASALRPGTGSPNCQWRPGLDRDPPTRPVAGERPEALGEELASSLMEAACAGDAVALDCDVRDDVEHDRIDPCDDEPVLASERDHCRLRDPAKGDRAFELRSLPASSSPSSRSRTSGCALSTSSTRRRHGVVPSAVRNGVVSAQSRHRVVKDLLSYLTT